MLHYIFKIKLIKIVQGINKNDFFSEFSKGKNY